MRNPDPKTIYFITGASAVGKTTLVNALSKKYQNKPWAFLHFDSIGIPSTSEMIRAFGSPPEWQRIKTFEWIDRLLHDHNATTIFFEGQVDPRFIKEGFARHGFENYRIVLLHCDVDSMRHRLVHDRAQPELFTDNMQNWLQYLKRQAEESQSPILDTSILSPEQLLTEFERLAGLDK